MKSSQTSTVSRWLAGVGASCLLALAAFNSGAGSGDMGTLNVSLTDAPACCHDPVYVTVDHVEISPDGEAWTTLPVKAGLSRIDLLSLTNGTLLALGSMPLVAGMYEQVRLVLQDNGSTTHLGQLASVSSPVYPVSPI